jgi:quinol monooxygenase YgiN
MIIISACLHTEPGTVEAMTEAIITMMKASEAEEGCYAYVFSTEVGNPTNIRIFEQWEDEAALKAHFNTPHMAAFQAAMAENPPTGTDLKAFDVTGEIPFPDVS